MSFRGRGYGGFSNAYSAPYRTDTPHSRGIKPLFPSANSIANALPPLKIPAARVGGGGGGVKRRKTVGIHTAPLPLFSDASTSTTEEEISGPLSRPYYEAPARGLNVIQAATAGGILCNGIKVDTDDVRRSSTSVNVPLLQVHTSDICGKLVDIIRNKGAGCTVVGCVAWFSNELVLKALIDTADRTLFVVNDENYGLARWKKTLSLYDALPRFQEPLHSAYDHYPTCPLISLDRDAKGRKYKRCHYEAVRAMGNPTMTQQGGGGGFSHLMHNKFLVFFKKTGGPDGTKDVPCAVFTGSFNVTQNATGNLESVVYIEDDVAAKKLFDYFAIIFMHSNPLQR